MNPALRAARKKCFYSHFLKYFLGKFSTRKLQEPAFFESVGVYFDEASKLANISPATLAHIKAPDTSLTFTFPIEVKLRGIESFFQFFFTFFICRKQTGVRKS